MKNCELLNLMGERCDNFEVFYVDENDSFYCQGGIFTFEFVGVEFQCDFQVVISNVVLNHKYSKTSPLEFEDDFETETQGSKYYTQINTFQNAKFCAHILGGATIADRE